MNGREIIELIQRHNLEDVKIGLIEFDNFGEVMPNPIKGLVKINASNRVCYFADEEMLEGWKGYTLT